MIFIVHYLLLRLRGTIPGAYNRLDLLSLVTCGVDENDIASGTEDVIIDGWQDDETHNPDIPAISHRRGMQPFVFIPFEEVNISFLFFLFIAAVSDYVFHVASLL